MCFGKQGGGEKKAAAELEGQRGKIEDALAQYNSRSTPFFGLEQSRGEFGQSFFPALSERINNPLASPTFQLYAKEGLNNLRSNFATTGSPSSGPAQIAGGRYLEGLAGQQLDKADNLLMGAANFRGQLPMTQEPQYLGMNAQLSQGIAQAKQADAANSGSGFGGLFGNLLGLGVSSLGAGGPFGSGGAFGKGGIWGP
jgi:hypothetical protein